MDQQATNPWPAGGVLLRSPASTGNHAIRVLVVFVVRARQVSVAKGFEGELGQDEGERFSRFRKARTILGV